MINVFCLSQTHYFEHQPIEQEGIQLVGQANEMAEGLRHLQPDVLLFDVDGFPAERVIHQLAQWKKELPGLKVIAVACLYTSEAILLKLIEVGIDSLLLKKQKMEKEVVHAINGVFQNHFELPTFIVRTFITELMKLKTATRERLTIYLHKNEIFLTKRETDVAFLLKQGLKNSDIATRLDLNPATVKVYISNIYKKVNCKKRNDVIAFLNGTQLPT